MGCRANAGSPPRKVVHLAVLHCFKMFLLLGQSGVGSNISATEVSHGVLQVVGVYAGASSAVWGRVLTA